MCLFSFVEVSGRLIGQMHVWPEAQAGVGRHGWWRRAGRWQLQLTVGPAFSTYCRRTLGCAPGRRASSPRTVCRGRRLGDRVTGHLHWDVLARGGRARLVAVRVSVSLSLSLALNALPLPPFPFHEIGTCDRKEPVQSSLPRTSISRDLQIRTSTKSAI